jgi:hypothetical protein
LPMKNALARAIGATLEARFFLIAPTTIAKLVEGNGYWSGRWESNPRLCISNPP